MSAFLKDVRELDRHAWLVIAAVGLGNIILVIGGLVGDPTFSLVVLAVLSFVWVLLLQFTRMIMHSSLDLAQESTTQWQAESDLTQEVVTEYVEVLHELKRFDLQSTGVHIARLRQSLIKRRPEMEEVISEVDHPLNMPGISI